MSPLALSKDYSWLRLISWYWSAGLFQHTRITLFPEPVISPGSCPWKWLNCFIKNQEILGSQLPLWEICAFPDYTGLSQEIVGSSSFRPWLTKNSFMAEDQNCWSIRTAWDLPPPLLLAQDPFHSFKKVPLWAMELFRVLDMAMAQVIFILINMQWLVNIFLPPLWLEN